MLRSNKEIKGVAVRIKTMKPEAETKRERTCEVLKMMRSGNLKSIERILND